MKAIRNRWLAFKQAVRFDLHIGKLRWQFGDLEEAPATAEVVMGVQTKDGRFAVHLLRIPVVEDLGPFEPQENQPQPPQA